VGSRWASPRALVVHVLAIVWVTGCVLAAYWQVGRAAQGNTLSYAYAVEWPAFAILGVLGWWGLIHIEHVDESKASERREFEERMRAEARLARELESDSEDPTLAAYNDHLAELAARPRRRIWGH
jgi:hypothetical protein